MEKRRQIVNKEMRWFQLLPLVNVEMAWANSMGFLNRIRVEGQLALTLNGHFNFDLQHSNTSDLTIDASLNPT